MTEQLRNEFARLVRAHVLDVRLSGNQVTGRVPWREDTHPSFSANLEKCVWYDHATNESGGVREFKQRLGLDNDDKTHAIIATYDYTDENGALLYQVVRFAPKNFRQRIPDGHGGWTWSLKGVHRVLYHLPVVLKAATVYLVEGEKDADRLCALGIPATTNCGGAGKWQPAYSAALRGKRVVILPDNDAPGEQHAHAVAQALLPVAAAVKIVRLPGLPPKGDVSDWLDMGHTRDELIAQVEKTPIFKLEAGNSVPPLRTGLSLTKLADLLKEPEEAVAWLVDGTLPSGGFSLFVAKPKVGKSTLARNLALAVARGDTFLNRATQKGAVIYLALEEKRSEVKKHFQDMGASGEEDIYIFAANAPVDALSQIRTVVEEKNPVLLIVDPLFRFMRVKDGNDYAQVTAAIEPLMVLARQTGAHVLCVHHAGKGGRDGGDSILGSTAIFAAVDTALILKRSERYRTISSTQRYGEDLPETVLRFDVTTRTISLGESKEKEEEQRLAEAIVEFLTSKNEAVTELEIDADVEGRRAVRKRALRSLVEAKTIFRDGDGKRGAPFRYALEKSWFAGSPHIDGNQGTRNGKVELTQQEDSLYTGSRQQDISDDFAKSREPAMYPYEEEL